MFRTLLVIFLFTSALSTKIFAQLEFKKYWVAFSDKNGTPYQITQPQSFLSPKAIERRNAYNIAIETNDLPVNPAYKEAVSNTGATVLYASKWMNGVVIQVLDSATLLAVQALPFVQNTNPISKKAFRGGIKRTDQLVQMKKDNEEADTDTIYYGTACHQIQMLNGHYLHAFGLKGDDMTVAILDAGFTNVNNNPVFAAHFANGQILGTKDFVDFDDNVYEHSNHGANVFSIMGGNLPGYYVGAAPNADFWLIRTEEGSSETRIEEYNWIAGAEFADSVGVDVINSSLGYSVFDNSFMNYTYNDMDGQVATVTRGADIAASKGILVVSSAGNEGSKPWQHITAPADADSILTVGSVDSTRIYSAFSSRGPSSDGRVKPNIVAQGQQTAYVNIAGDLEKGNGTSYSSPLMAGLATCLWQANRQYNNMNIISYIQQSANRYLTPNDSIGYGLPDFHLAMQLMGVYPTSIAEQHNAASFLYPNPANTDISLYYYAPHKETIIISLYNLSGQLLHSQSEQVDANLPYRFTIDSWDALPESIYLIQIQNGTERQTLKAIKK